MRLGDQVCNCKFRQPYTGLLIPTCNILVTKISQKKNSASCVANQPPNIPPQWSCRPAPSSHRNVANTPPSSLLPLLRKLQRSIARQQHCHPIPTPSTSRRTGLVRHNRPTTQNRATTAPSSCPVRRARFFHCCASCVVPSSVNSAVVPFRRHHHPAKLVSSAAADQPFKIPRRPHRRPTRLPRPNAANTSPS